MRILRRALHVLIVILTLVIGAAAAAIIVSQTAWFKNWLRGYIVREANQYLNGTLSIERLGGSLLFGIEMENIGLSMNGSQVVAVKDLGLDYNVFELITKGLSVDSIRLDHPVVYLRRDGDGWELSSIVKKQETEADRSGPGKAVSIDEIGISDGDIEIDGPVGTSGVAVPKKFEHLDAKFSFKYAPVRYSIEISHISFRATDPGLALNALSGGIAVHDDAVHVQKLQLHTAESSIAIDGAVQSYLSKPNLNLRVTSDKLSIPEIARLVPALAGVKLQPAFEVQVAGPLDQLGVDMNVRSSAGQLTGSIVADVLEPQQSVKGDVTVRNLDLAPILDDARQRSDITATAHLDVHAASFSDLNSLGGGLSVESPKIAAAGYAAGPLEAKAQLQGRRVALTAHAQAYGASASASGHVVLPDTAKNANASTIPFDLSGEARRIDLRRMPKSAGVPPAATDVNAEYHVAGSVTTGKHPTRNVKADLKFQSSSVAGAQIAGGSTASATINGKAIGYSADASIAHLDLQEVGKQFNVATLAADRYKSAINGHVTASGSGTTPKDMNVAAQATLTGTTVMGGRVPQLTADVQMANDTAHVRANGSFEGFDPADLSANPKLKGSVGGTVDVDATVAGVSKGVTVDSVQASAKATLQPSTIGGLEITKANVDGDYRNSTGDIRALAITGRDLNVTGKGTLALNDEGQSNFQLHADSPSLAEIGKLVDRPLTGIAKIDAIITGNRRQLQAKGNLTADGAKYGDNGALTASSDFTASLPNLDAKNANVSATTHATFVTLAGQDINDLQAKTDYSQKQLEFDLTAKQPKRSLVLAGGVLLHPDHEEVHLTALNLTSQNVSWQLAPGSKPAVNYADNAVRVEGLTLASGAQQLSADGTWGKPGDALKVTLKDVDMATVDALLMRPPELTGTLNATSTIRGTKDAPKVDADFQIAGGSVKQVQYDSFKGTVKYADDAATLDVRLQQTPTAWVEAKGTVPTALFNGTAAGSSRPVDLHVDSSPIDLALAQGFTDAVSNVKGTVEAHVALTGTAGDPQPDGGITIQNGAFKVEATGVAYSSLEGKIGLQKDRVHIDKITLLDNAQKPLTVTGDLAVHESQLGSVSIALKADDFKVIDNDMGNVRIKSDLQLTGDVTAPRVEGSLGLTTGRINLDPILAKTGDSAYATKQTEYATDASDQGQQASPGMFDALQMDVHVTVPQDLVIKSSDLKTPGAPIGLGALNVTLGGDVWASKSPWDQIRLVGVVNTVRGTYDFQGRRFTILRDGTIRFEGLDDLNPTLDIKTERVIQAVTADVNIRGTVQKPEIVLTSNPPLEQADIMSLIVFNQPINSVSETQQISLAQRVESMAAGQATGALTKSISSALNLDTFEVNLAPENGGGPHVTLGQQIGQNLYVKVEQGITDASQTNFILEYELLKWLRLRTNVLQGSATQSQLFQRMQGSGADLLFFFSY
ncbi:MAG TPA: translocation/assembly module TamB domain-containing protein [Vicinamibacterales bacterium]|nr:translocation/assembly module TamB domain-containing protein [Vicinamibacterales bacterium]